MSLTHLPGKRSLVLTPSCFLVEPNTTVLAGMFTPIANVSVANSSYNWHDEESSSLIAAFQLEQSWDIHHIPLQVPSETAVRSPEKSRGYKATNLSLFNMAMLADPKANFDFRPCESSLLKTCSYLFDDGQDPTMVDSYSSLQQVSHPQYLKEKEEEKWLRKLF